MCGTVRGLQCFMPMIYQEKMARRAQQVVVVEDEPILRFHVVELLKEAGLSVVDFGTADRADEFLHEHADIVAFLFTDVDLPGRLNGLKLAELANQLWPWIDVVVTSGRAEYHQLEGNRFMRKPWCEELIVQAAKDSVARHMQ